MTDNQTIEQQIEIAKEDALALRQRVLTTLVAALPQSVTVTAEDRPVAYSDKHEHVLVVAEGPVRYTLRFYAAPAERSLGYYHRRARYAACVALDQYTRDGRRVSPRYKPRKDGTYNMAAVIADVQQALASRRAEHERDVRKRTAMQQSRETLATILKAHPDMAKPYAYSDYEKTLPRCTLTITPGDFSGGRVRVRIALHNEYLTAEEVSALIAALNQSV